MFNCIKKFIRRKKAQTQRFISLYLTDTPTEYDYFFKENKPNKPVEKLIKNDIN